MKTLQDLTLYHKSKIDNGGSCGDGTHDVHMRNMANKPHEQAVAILENVEPLYGLGDTIVSIRGWAEDRNLIEGATSQAQMLKMTEEVGELAHAIARGKKAEMKDAIGDCVVVLTILAAQNDMTIEECVRAAYNEIKDRKGKMVNGVFVKDAE